METPEASAEFPIGINTVLINQGEIEILKKLAAKKNPTTADLLSWVAKQLILRILTIPPSESTGVSFLGGRPWVSFDGDVARFANPKAPIHVALPVDENGNVILIAPDAVEAYKNRPKPNA